MSEGPDAMSAPAGAPESEAPQPAIEPAPAEAAVQPPRTQATFRSARWPSGPFWIALLLVLFGLIVFLLSASALFVFAVGVALAFFLVPVVSWFERRGLARWVSAIIVVVLTVAISLALLGIVALVVVDQGLSFVRNLPAMLQELQEWYESLGLPEWLRAGIDSIIASVEENLQAVDQGQVLAGFIGGAFDLVGGLFAWFLLPFFLFYLLKDQPKMSANFYRRVPAPWKDDISHMLTVSVGNFAQYFRAEFVVGSIMFAIVTVGMIVIGTAMGHQPLVDFAVLLGLIAFVMELIPQIGPILSYIPALLISLPGGIEVVVVVSVFYFIIFNFEGSVLVPNLEGKMIDFSGASVLVLIAIGFALGASSAPSWRCRWPRPWATSSATSSTRRSIGTWSTSRSRPARRPGRPPPERSHPGPPGRAPRACRRRSPAGRDAR